MRISPTALALALASALAFTPASAETDSALRDRMQATAAATSIDDPSLKPWHLKLTVQLAGASTAGGTIVPATVEEWWAAPSMYRITLTAADHSFTEVSNADGVFRSGVPEQLPPELDAMRMQVVHPMPTAPELETARLDQRVEKLGKLPLDCIMVGQAIKGLASTPLGLFPTYCLDQNKALLRLTYDFGSLQTVRMQTGTFQGRNVAIKIGTLDGGKPGATAQVDTLAAMPEAQMDLAAPKDAHKAHADPITLAPGVMAGSVVHRVNPYYPESARQRHVQGDVVLSAIIGRDGHIHSLTLVSYPDPELAVAALSVVRQWTYRPYLLNGDPVEVNTTITVNFRMGS